MAQTYCGILGLVAFLTTLARGWIHGGDVQSTMWNGWLNLLLFSIVGVVIGWIAESIVDDSVNARLAAQMTAKTKSGTKTE